MTTIAKVGDLAYIDTFGGLVKCKIVHIATVRGLQRISVQVTHSKGGYRKGETVTKLPYEVIPRRNIFVRDRKYRINNDYRFEEAA